MGFGGGSAWGGGASPGQFHGWCPNLLNSMPSVGGEERLKLFQEDQDKAMGPILLQHLVAMEEDMVEAPVVLEVINNHFVQLKPYGKYFDMLLKLRWQCMEQWRGTPRQKVLRKSVKNPKFVMKCECCWN